MLPDPPKDLQKNALFREFLRTKCDESANWRRAVVAKCRDGADGLVWWTDAMAMCFHPKGEGAVNPHLPMVTFPFQERFMRWLHERIVKQDGGAVIEKCRAMTATWSVLTVFDWFWLFTENGNFLITSRKEEYVDGKGKRAIMPRLDYQIDRLKRGFPWLVPDGYEPRIGTKWRTFKGMVNPVFGNTILGEATNRNLGAGDRQAAALVDEAALIDYLDRVVAALGPVTDCPLYVSTHKGAGTYFNRLVKGKHVASYRMPWMDHPDWNEGIYECQPGCQAHPEGGKPHSRAFDDECAKLNWDPVMIASELEMDPIRSGNTVFDMGGVDAAQTHLEQNPPKLVSVRLEWDRTGPITLATGDRYEWFRAMRDAKVKASEIQHGPFRVWRMPFSCRDSKCACAGTGRHVYVTGGDVSKGLRRGDNNILYVLDCTTGAFVAEWAGKLDPDDVAVEWAKVAKFYGTSSGGLVNAFTGVEWNNNGDVVLKVLDQLGIWLQRSRSFDKQINQYENRLGIVVTRHNKGKLIFEGLVPAIRGRDSRGLPMLCVPFREFWEECLTFVNAEPDAKGAVEPEATKLGAMSGCHDDRVMAAAHAIYTAQQRYGKWIGVVDKEDKEDR